MNPNHPVAPTMLHHPTTPSANAARPSRPHPGVLAAALAVRVSRGRLPPGRGVPIGTHQLDVLQLDAAVASVFIAAEHAVVVAHGAVGGPAAAQLVQQARPVLRVRLEEGGHLLQRLALGLGHEGIDEQEERGAEGRAYQEADAGAHVGAALVGLAIPLELQEGDERDRGDEPVGGARHHHPLGAHVGGQDLRGEEPADGADADAEEGDVEEEAHDAGPHVAGDEAAGDHEVRDHNAAGGDEEQDAAAGDFVQQHGRQDDD
mmetsp:Transcript_13830/g.35537  ORF Transcript_13830/g.35537 Transcript_13830/m.35537 type:complete len:261 (+) Transcript_13830:118-900(+)